VSESTDTAFNMDAMADGEAKEKWGLIDSSPVSASAAGTAQWSWTVNIVNYDN
jgi:hypothetical protein